MLDRKDALVSAVEILGQLPELAIQEGGGTVLTVGKLNVYPNGANVIPDKVIFTVDIRAKDEIHVQNTLAKTKEIIQATEKWYYLRNKRYDLPTTNPFIKRDSSSSNRKCRPIGL